MIGLHNHLEYSNLRLRDSTNKIEDLLLTAHEMGYMGMSITDHESVSGHVKSLKTLAKLKEKNKLPSDFKLILGNEIYLVDSLEEVRDNYQGGGITKFPHFLLLAKDKTGHDQLRYMSSQAWKQSFQTGLMLRTPTTKEFLRTVVQENPGHLIASSACFLKGTLVKTRDGLKAIEDIITGDEVLTHTEKWKRVIEPTSRQYNGNLKTIFTKGSALPITATENHKFLTIPHRTSKNSLISEIEIDNEYYELLSAQTTQGSKKQMYKRNAESIKPIWKEAASLQETDSVLTPIESKIEEKEYVDISFSHRENSKYKLPNEIKITPHLLEILGLYAAEGSKNTHSQSGITFTIDSRKTEIIKSISNFFENVMNLKVSIYPKKGNFAFDLTISSVEVYDLFDTWFGSGAKNKNMPEFIRYLSPTLQKYFIKGLFLGDGHERVTTSQRARNNISFCTISRQLIDDVTHILHRMWINPCVTIIPERTDKKGVHHQEAYSCEISGSLAKKMRSFIWDNEELKINMEDRRTKDIPFKWENKYYMKHCITKINTENYLGTVHCLNVDTDHSFVANGMIVHNCLGSEICIHLLAMKKALENNNREEAKEHYFKGCEFIKWCIEVFGKEDFYLELQPAYSEEQIYCNKHLLKLADKFNLKYVITTDSHYLRPEDRVVHKAFLNSKEGEREVDSFYEATFVQNLQEIQERLDYLPHEVIKEALKNTIEIGAKIEEYTILKPTVVPKISIPEFKIRGLFKRVYEQYEYINKMAHSENEQDRYMIKLLEDGVVKYLPYKTYTSAKMHQVMARINVELEELWKISETVNQAATAYYITVQKIVDIMWADDCGDSLVGPSRGSALGFLICYLLGITQINPLEQGIELPHWRHLTASRPD